MIAYLDTHVVMFLAEATRSRISKPAEKLIREADLLISPMVLIELEYLYEIGRLRWPSRELYLKIERETSLKTCALPFSTVARTAIDEKWTRDTFDRIIVAQAKTNGLAFLISADEDVAKHYQRTVW